MSKREKQTELPPYDPEVELKKIETWEKIANENIEKVLDFLHVSKKIEYQSTLAISKWIFVLIGIFFVITAVLTYTGKVSGDSLVFLIGIIVGYMLSLISAKPRREPA